MSTRYTEAAGRVAERLEIQEAGLGIVVAPATEQAPVADALAARWPVARRTTLTPEIVGEPFSPVIATLPAEAAQAAAALGALNGARQRIAAAGRIIVLVVSRAELQAVQRLAGDSYSTAMFVEVCAFVPDAAVAYEAAREALGRWLRQRIGRLDLRGFIRAHTEDVAWTVEEVYQALRGRVWLDDADALALHAEEEPPLVDAVARALAAQRDTRSSGSTPAVAVVLGHPGSGKTFFLRWLALRAASADEFLGVHAPLPVLVSLAAFARAPRPMSLHDYIIESLLQEDQPAAHVLDRAMQQGQVLFLLDGLDEAGDEAGRRQVAKAIQALAGRAPGCPIVATSRLSGYTDAPLPGRHIAVQPLDDEAIERFLITWCRLYACELHGAHAAERGEEEGRRLARDVLASAELKALAQNPLLLTVLAIVHRTSVRLPDHRVELYSHATQILVERWNQVRSLSGMGNPSPIKVADAVRLLGPVALDMVRAGVRGAMSEEALVQSLERSLAARPLRSITSAREALALFQRSLGLLVEQGPGMYGFLHLTLAEYFAAWELVRSGELEALVQDPKQAFRPQWREVILLAAGELGVNRADDVRLDNLVDALIASASRRRGRPAITVPSLLTGLLADDPGLSECAARDIAACLIPTFWFERRYEESQQLATPGDVVNVVRRIANGRVAAMLRERLRAYFAQGLGDAAFDYLGRQLWTGAIRPIAQALEVDDSPLLLWALKNRAQQARKEHWKWLIPVIAKRATLRIGRGVVDACQRGAVRLVIHGCKMIFSADRKVLAQQQSQPAPLRVDWNAVDLAASDAAYVDVPFTIESSTGEKMDISMTGLWFISIYIADWALPDE